MAQQQSSEATVAVLGAGIMGSSVALYLVRKGLRVVLIDAAAEPFMGASRWNEGKIHLGYLYGADPSMKTARKLLPGGLRFPALVSDLIGRKLDDRIVTQHDDRYLIHRNSVARPEQVFALAERIAALTSEHADADQYFVPLRGIMPRRLSSSELQNDYNTEEIVAGIEVPERSVSTVPIADAFVEALRGSSGIELIMEQRVVRVGQASQGSDRWTVESVDAAGQKHSLGSFRAVVNALWEGRPAIDATVGLQGPATRTHRYRVSVFAKTKRPVDLRSAVIAVGPFGDVKNYDSRHLYLSWYDTGLLAEGQDLLPPPVEPPNDAQAQRIAQDKLRNLAHIIPAAGQLFSKFDSFRVRGGWVYAAGRGALSRVDSELHRRDRIGLVSWGNYFSVDTGKYSIAPWLAAQVADAVAKNCSAP